MTPAAWWRGERGEGFVALQVVLIGLLAIGPRTLHGWPPWRFPEMPVVFVAGGFLLLTGLTLLVWGVLRLGSGLTPLPYPKAGAQLRETGPYRFVRHPMYGGVILLAFGWALWVHGWLTLGYAGLAVVLLEVKVRREERWLTETYPAYDAYRRRVHKFIPFVY